MWAVSEAPLCKAYSKITNWDQRRQHDSRRATAETQVNKPKRINRAKEGYANAQKKNVQRTQPRVWLRIMMICRYVPPEMIMLSLGYIALCGRKHCELHDLIRLGVSLLFLFYLQLVSSSLHGFVLSWLKLSKGRCVCTILCLCVRRWNWFSTCLSVCRYFLRIYLFCFLRLFLSHLFFLRSSYIVSFLSTFLLFLPLREYDFFLLLSLLLFTARFVPEERHRRSERETLFTTNALFQRSQRPILCTQ